MRTFLAIELPPHIQTYVAENISNLRTQLQATGLEKQLQWVPLANLHLTVRFFGDTSTVQAEALAHALTEIASQQAPFALALTQLGGFPNLQRPRVLWLGVAGELPQLHALNTAVESAAQEVGFTAEARGYTPHITLARAQRRAKQGELQGTGQQLQTIRATPSAAEPPTFVVQELVHFASHFQRCGPLYKPLGRYPFAHHAT